MKIQTYLVITLFCYYLAEIFPQSNQGIHLNVSGAGDPQHHIVNRLNALSTGNEFPLILHHKLQLASTQPDERGL